MERDNDLVTHRYHKASADDKIDLLAFGVATPAVLAGVCGEVEHRERHLLVATHERTHLPLVVAENGAAYADEVRAPDGSVDDQDRIAYLRDHIAAVERARTAGADVRAYVAWTLLDNFEWAEGYTKKFGLVEVSPADPTRSPKASYRWYSDLVHAGRSAGAVG